jgi:hypothetical protein
MPDSKRRTLLAPGVLLFMFLLIEVEGMCIVERHIADIANPGEFPEARLQARVEVVLRGRSVAR